MGNNIRLQMAIELAVARLQQLAGIRGQLSKAQTFAKTNQQSAMSHLQFAMCNSLSRSLQLSFCLQPVVEIPAVAAPAREEPLVRAQPNFLLSRL
jgi:hypothetical protein